MASLRSRDGDDESLVSFCRKLLGVGAICIVDEAGLLDVDCGDTGISDPRSRGLCQLQTRFRRLQWPHTSRAPSHRFRLSHAMRSELAPTLIELTYLRRHVRQPILSRLLTGRSCDWTRVDSTGRELGEISSISLIQGWCKTL